MDLPVCGLFIYVGLVLLKIPYALFIGLWQAFDAIPILALFWGFLPQPLPSPAPSQCSGCCSLLPPTRLKRLISPWLIGDRVGLHPLAVVFAVLVGGHLAYRHAHGHTSRGHLGSF